jgi:hypothetical protein
MLILTTKYISTSWRLHQIITNLESPRQFPQKRILYVTGVIIITALIISLTYVEVWSPSAQVKQDFFGHIYDIENASSRQIDTSFLVQDYESNATVMWLGETSSIGIWMSDPSSVGGTYSNTTSILNLYKTFFEFFMVEGSQSLVVSHVAYTVKIEGANSAMVNSSFDLEGPLSGVSPPAQSNSSTPKFADCAGGPNFSATVVVQVSYTHSSDGWLISDEIWNFESVCP